MGRSYLIPEFRLSVGHDKTKPMRKLLFTLFFGLMCGVGHCQITSITKQVDVDVLAPASEKLKGVLDSVLSTEKKRAYYRPDKYFSITVLPDSTLQIQAIDYLFAMPKDMTKDVGVILRGGHSFFVSGCYLDPEIFRSTGEKKQYTYYTDSVYKNGKCELVYLTSHDDSYSVWIYKFTDGEFELIRFCDTSIIP